MMHGILSQTCSHRLSTLATIRRVAKPRRHCTQKIFRTSKRPHHSPVRTHNLRAHQLRTADQALADAGIRGRQSTAPSTSPPMDVKRHIASSCATRSACCRHVARRQLGPGVLVNNEGSRSRDACAVRFGDKVLDVVAGLCFPIVECCI